MKRILTLALTLLCALALLPSCEKAPFITMTGPRTFTFTRDGGTQTFTFSCNRDWSVSSSESWIKVSPTSGKAEDGEITVKITCDPNSTYDARSATVTVKLAEISESLTITQDTGIGLILSPTTFTLTNAAQDIEIEVQKNVPYSINIDEAAASWIKAGGTKALTTDKVTFHISENKDYDDREGKITFKQTDGPLTSVVIVKQNQKDGLFINVNKYKIAQGGGTVEVAVSANVEYEVEPKVEWVHYVETKALNNTTTILTVDENDTYEPRDASVAFKQKNGDLVVSISINQAERIAVSSVSLSKSTTALIVGDSDDLSAVALPDNATDDKTITWASSNDAVATVENGKITAVGAGTAIIYAKAGNVSSECFVRVQIVPEGAVNLGTVSYKEDGSAYLIFWATKNIGASNPEDYGDYYAWGEKETKLEYNWSSYKWTTDDVAKETLGGNWRIPTAAELIALSEQCTWTWITKNGIKGMEVKNNKSSDSIFLPAGGVFDNTKIADVGLYGGYWSSTLYSTYSDYAEWIFFSPAGCSVNNCEVWPGRSIRPVTE